MNRIKQALPFLLLILPLILYLPFIGKVALPKGSPYSDLLISHLPNAIFIHRSIAQAHQVPLWNDTIMSGYPFFADPLSGLWYPLIWLANWIPLPAAFNLLFLLHLLWGGLGLFLFLKKEGMNQYAAMIAAISFECLPKTWAHFAAGHVTLVFACSWTPWLLLAARNRWQKSKSRFLLTTEFLILAVIILCDIRWSVYAAGLWAIFSIREAILNRAKNNQKTLLAVLISIAHMVTQLLISSLLTAAFILPFLEFVSLSSRSSLPPLQNLFLSLPPLNLFNLFVPAIGGYAEWVLYLGGLGIFSLLLCLFNKALRKQTSFWLVTFGICLLLSLGANIPGLSILFSLPVLNLLRVPARINFLTGMIACILIGYSINWFLAEKRILSWLRLTVVAISMIYLMIGIGISIINQRIETGIFWAFLILVSILIISIIFSRERLAAGLFIGILIGMSIVDLSVINLLSMRFQGYSQPPGEEASSMISGLTGFSQNRIYSPSFAITQLDASASNLSLINGIDPLSLRTYSTFLEKASGVPNYGYSVTLPGLVTGNPDSDNQYYKPNLEILGLLNTKYLVSVYPINTPGIVNEGKYGSLYAYENPLAKPRIWLEDPNSGKIIPITDYEIQPNTVHITTSGPGLLVLSEINYPGWIVKVDGVQTKIIPYADILRSISLPAGVHDILFEYHPTCLLIGSVASVVTALSLVAYFNIRRRKTRENRSNEKLVS